MLCCWPSLVPRRSRPLTSELKTRAQWPGNRFAAGHLANVMKFRAKSSERKGTPGHSAVGQHFVGN